MSKKSKIKLVTLITLASLLNVLQLGAQSVKVNVAPTQNPLPPQALTYFDNPGRFFTVNLQNVSNENLNVYLGIEIEQTGLSDGIGLTTPVDIQPQRGLVLPANMTVPVTLSAVDLKNVFKHLSTNDLILRGPTITDYSSGIIGLLPEGHYRATLTVYRLEYGVMQPEVLSDPLMSSCYFDICYSAEPPIILEPQHSMFDVLSSDESSIPEGSSVSAQYLTYGQTDASFETALLDVNQPQFLWKAPQMTCSSTPRQYTYTLNLYKINPGRTPADALNDKLIVYTKGGIMAPQYIIPSTSVNALKSLGCYFLAEVVADPVIKQQSNELYSTIQNEGRSPYVVFRFDEKKNGGGIILPVVPEDADTTSTNSDEKVAKYILNPPTITKPKDDGTVWGAQIYKEKKDSIIVTWDKPTIKSGPTDWNGKDTLEYKYTVKAIDVKSGMELEDLLITPGFQMDKNRKVLNDTIHFAKIDKAMEPGGVIAVVVTAECTNEKDIKFEDTYDNIVKVAYLQLTSSEFLPCSEGADSLIKNRELGLFNEKELRNMRVHIGEFPLVMTKAILKNKKYYQGEGYVIWKPWGSTEIQIAVSFDSLYINTDTVVFKNSVHSMAEPTMKDIVPYGLFDKIGLGNFAENNIKSYGPIISTYLQDDSDIGQYYKYIQEGSRLIDRLCGKDAGPVYLPIGLPKEIPECPVDIQFMNAEFSATTAWIDLFAMFKIPENEYSNTEIAAFGLPHHCIGPESFISEGDSILVSLLTDISLKDPDSKYEFKLKSPSDIVDMEDGCWIAISDKGEFKGCCLDVAMSLPNLLKDDGKGNVVKGALPEARGVFYFKDWSDWTATFKMDAFQVEDAPGWSFAVADKGMTYDHSVSKNASTFTLPKGYDKKKKGALKVAGDEKSWQGFYLSQLQVRFPKVFEVSDTPDDDGQDVPPGSAAPKYGRIALGAKDFLFDDSGICFTFAAENVLKAHTVKAGGWGITLDEMGLTVIQNDFNNCFVKGTFDVPLFKSKNPEEDFKYDFKMVNADHGESLKYIFNVTPVKECTLDMWLATCELDADRTHFTVEADDDNTYVELLVGGEISINAAKDKAILGYDIPGVHFKGMRMANYDAEERKKAEEEKKKAEEEKKKAEAGETKADDATQDPKSENPDGGSGDKKEEKKDDASKKGDDKKDEEETTGIELFNFHNQAKTFFLSSGYWSLSSDKKKLGGFDFNLKDWNVKNRSKGDDEQMGLYVNGEITMLDGQLTAGAALTVWGKLDMNNFDCSYDETTFDGISFKSSFGGVKVEGSMEAVDDNGAKGYKGSLGFELPGDLFSLTAEGQFVEKEMSAEEASVAKVKPDSITGKYPSYNSAYFLGEVGLPIDCGGVKLKDIEGGFYFHTNYEKEPKYGVHGGMFGLGISTSDGKAIEGNMKMTVVYDAVKKQLSTFRMIGDMKALDGVVNAKASIVYRDVDVLSPDTLMRDFHLSITADASADFKDAYKNLTGKELEIPKAITDLKEMEDKDANKTKNDKESGNDKQKEAKEADEALSAKCSASVSLDFRVQQYFERETKVNDDGTTSYSRGDTKKTYWHLYVGEPEESKRCQITIIDFQLGGKDDKVACWGKLYANAYLCIGNELPGNGALPGIPTEIKEFLDGKNQSGQSQKAEEARQANAKVFNPDEQTGKAAIKGGVMFGAAMGGDFGLNAVICYARATAIAGFDLILKQFDEGATCTDGSRMGGAGGMYGTGQVYALIKGELGLIIDLWIFKGKIPLIDVGLGALLQGGFPNPSWFHGKARAKCSLLGGLIKFNSSLEIKAGNVCIPAFGNPLDDIKMFEEMTVGSTDIKEGWNPENPVSCYNTPAFTTNMVIGKELRLIDEEARYKMAGWDEDPTQYDENAKRSYFFYLQPSMQMSIYDRLPSGKGETGAIETRKVGYQTDNFTSYNLLTGARLMPEKYYKVTLSGYCKELRDGKVVDPVYRDESTNWENKSKPWAQDTVYYFYTNKLDADLFHDVILTEPYGNAEAYVNELNQPKLHMIGDRSEDLANENYDYTATLEVYDENLKDWALADLRVAPVMEYDDLVHAYLAVDPEGTQDKTSGYIYDRYGNVIDSVDVELVTMLSKYRDILTEANDRLNKIWRINTIVPYTWTRIVNDYKRFISNQWTGIDYNEVRGDHLNEYMAEAYYKRFHDYEWQEFFRGISDHFDMNTFEGVYESMRCMQYLFENCYTADKQEILDATFVLSGKADEAEEKMDGCNYVSPIRLHVTNQSKLNDLIVEMRKIMDRRGISYETGYKSYAEYCTCYDNSEMAQKRYDATLAQSGSGTGFVLVPLGDDSSSSNNSELQSEFMGRKVDGTTSNTEDKTVFEGIKKLDTSGSGETNTSSASEETTSTSGTRIPFKRSTVSEEEAQAAAVLAEHKTAVENAISSIVSSVVSNRISGTALTDSQKNMIVKEVQNEYQLGEVATLEELYEESLAIYNKVYSNTDIALESRKSLYTALQNLGDAAGISTSSLPVPIQVRIPVKKRAISQNDGSPSISEPLYLAMTDGIRRHGPSPEPYMSIPSEPNVPADRITTSRTPQMTQNMAAINVARESLNMGTRDVQQAQLNLAQSNPSANVLDISNAISSNGEIMDMSRGFDSSSKDFNQILNNGNDGFSGSLSKGSVQDLMDALGGSKDYSAFFSESFIKAVGERLSGVEKADVKGQELWFYQTEKARESCQTAASNLDTDVPQTGPLADFFAGRHFDWEQTRNSGTTYDYNPPKSENNKSTVEAIPVKENVKASALTDMNDFYYWYADKDLSSFHYDPNRRYRLTFTRTDKSKLEDLLNKLQETYKQQAASFCTDVAQSDYGKGTYDESKVETDTTINVRMLMQKYYDDVFQSLGGDSAEVMSRKFAEAKKLSKYELVVYTIEDFTVNGKRNFASVSKEELLPGEMAVVLDDVDYVYRDDLTASQLIGDPINIGTDCSESDYKNYETAQDSKITDAIFHDPYYCLAWLGSGVFLGGKNIKGGDFCSDEGYNPASTLQLPFADETKYGSLVGGNWGDLTYKELVALSTSNRVDPLVRMTYWNGSDQFAKLRDQMKIAKTHQVSRSHQYSTANHLAFYDLSDAILTEVQLRLMDYNSMIKRDCNVANVLLSTMGNDFKKLIIDCNGKYSEWKEMGVANNGYYDAYHIPVIYGQSLLDRDALTNYMTIYNIGAPGKYTFHLLLRAMNRNEQMEYNYSGHSFSPTDVVNSYSTTFVRYNGYHTRTGSNNENGTFGYDVRPGTATSNTRKIVVTPSPSAQASDAEYDWK